MSVAYVVVTLVAIAANAVIAALALAHHPQVRANMAKVGVPELWLTVLGGLKAAGAAGLLLGLAGVPFVGTAAAIGLSLFFVGAIVTHLRAGDHSLAYPSTFLLLAIAALVLDVAS